MALELQVLRMLRFSIASFEIREASNNVPQQACHVFRCCDPVPKLQTQ